MTDFGSMYGEVLKLNLFSMCVFAGGKTLTIICNNECISRFGKLGKDQSMLFVPGGQGLGDG